MSFRLTVGRWTLTPSIEVRILERRPVLGRVAEWFKAAVLKTAVGESPPWVRIPPLPPTYIKRGHSSVGRAIALQAIGRRFDPVWLHHFVLMRTVL